MATQQVGLAGRYAFQKLSDLFSEQPEVVQGVLKGLPAQQRAGLNQALSNPTNFIADAVNFSLNKEAAQQGTPLQPGKFGGLTNVTFTRAHNLSQGKGPNQTPDKGREGR